MVTVTFRCDNCGFEKVVTDLHHGYAMPSFVDMDVCLNCRFEALQLLKETVKE